MATVEIRRLTAPDRALARALFIVMSNVFEDDPHPLGDAYLDALLARDDFWALVAQVDGVVAGGITAHTLCMTRSESRELFIYDLAVVPAYQQQGIGRQLIHALTRLAAAERIDVSFVAADDEDAHAIDFYRAVGGDAAPVTMFTFTHEQRIA